MEVKVITRKTCAPCGTLKKWLYHHDIKFTEYDADERPEVFDKLVEKTGYAIVPLTIIGNEIIPGLNFHRIRNTIESQVAHTS